VYSATVVKAEAKKYSSWQEDLLRISGFSPVLIDPTPRGNSLPPLPGETYLGPDKNSDDIGVVTVHDGPTIPSGEIIAPKGGAALTPADISISRIRKRFSVLAAEPPNVRDETLTPKKTFHAASARLSALSAPRNAEVGDDSTRVCLSDLN
jgi:hypothetical protein